MPLSDLPAGVVVPGWRAPRRVRALTTLRGGGASAGPWASLNLADHVGDEAAAVASNRRFLRTRHTLPAEPMWLQQVHRTRIVDAARSTPGCEADGAWTDTPGVVCAVLTADCLPVFLARRDGSRVALLHAGWRGLAAGIIKRGVQALGGAPGELQASLGPAIGRRAFEVDTEVHDRLITSPADAAAFARSAHPGYWLADLYALANARLRGCGVTEVGACEACTFSEPARYFSYRRDGECGRMASLIWIEP